MVNKPKFDYRDVSEGLQKLRELLLGRSHTLHGRFAPGMSPRTIPPPDIPKGPDSTTSYSKQYYYMRSAFDSVKPPLVAPLATGVANEAGKDPKAAPLQSKGIKPEMIYFRCAPTPGMPWWWDGHCYYECTGDDQLVSCDPTEPADPKDCSKQGPNDSHSD